MNKQLEIEESDTLAGSEHPRLAKKLIGHKKAWYAFLNCKENGKLHHAWIISGPKGVGKATFSWKIAAKLIFDTPKKSDRDEQIPSLSDLFLCTYPKKTSYLVLINFIIS